VVLEIDLNHFIRKSEHNGMSGSHPLLDIDDFFDFPLLREFFFLYRFDFSLFGAFRFLTTFQVGSEVLEQSHLLL